MNIQTENNNDINPRLYGIGGWLYLLAIALIASSIFQIIKILKLVP